jgi:hypothetical protein
VIITDFNSYRVRFLGYRKDLERIFLARLLIESKKKKVLVGFFILCSRVGRVPYRGKVKK